MNALLIANIVGSAFIFMIWSKSSLLNVAFKGMFLALLIFNVLVLAKL